MDERLYRLKCDRCGAVSDWKSSPENHYTYPRIGWKRVGAWHEREGGWDYCPECSKDVIESTAWLVGGDWWWRDTHEIVSGKAVYDTAVCNTKTNRVMLGRLESNLHQVKRYVDGDFKVHLRLIKE